MARWAGRSVIKVVTPMQEGPPKIRTRYTPKVVIVEAGTPEEAERLIRDEITSSGYPPRPGDEHLIEDLRQLD